MATAIKKRRNRGRSSPYWSSGPGDGVTLEGMKSREELDNYVPRLPPLRDLKECSAPLVLKILEVCSGSCSVSRFTAAEAYDMGFDEVAVFSIDGKPGTGATRTADLLTYDYENDAELQAFRAESAGKTVIYYAHASPPCGPYSSMAANKRGPLDARDLRWGDTLVQRCLDLIAFFRPDYWTLESRGSPGLDTRCFMRSLEPYRKSVNYCRYGKERWKKTSIWTNVESWVPEPECTPSNRCAHFLENGTHADKVRRTANRFAPDFAALPEQLVRAWTRAALSSALLAT